jgi:hypothetical protein
MNPRRIITVLVLTILLVIFTLLYRSYLSRSEANGARLLETSRLERTKASNDRDAIERKLAELVVNMDRLSVSNAALATQLQAERTASQNIKKRLAASEQSAEPLPIVVPQTVAGIGRQWGSAKIKFYTFNQKYPKGPPANNTPDYDLYVNELDQLMSEFTPIMLKAQELPGLTSEPAEKARFRASMISEALTLDPVQASLIEGILRTAFQQSPKPSKDFSENVAAQVAGLLSIDQQARFKTMFGGNFLSEIRFSINGKDGKETSF